MTACGFLSRPSCSRLPSPSLAGQAPAKSWTALKTAWGDPDISGIFTTDDELGVPFERPVQFGDRAVRDAPRNSRSGQAQAERQEDADREGLRGAARRPPEGGPAAAAPGRPRTGSSAGSRRDARRSSSTRRTDAFRSERRGAAACGRGRRRAHARTAVASTGRRISIATIAASRAGSRT